MPYQSGVFPLFKGATRLPTFGGVPRMVLLGTFMFCAAAFMTMHAWAVGLFGFLWFTEWCIAKHDDRMFRILVLTARTKVFNRINSPFTELWSGSSYSTVDYEGKD